jgi:elongation of very long chain fatty acids protein 6
MEAMLAQLRSAEESFQSSDLIRFMLAYPDIPIACTLLYLGLVLYMPQVMDSRPPLKLKPAVALWNLVLTAFSIAGSLVCIPRLLFIIQNKSMFSSLCGSSRDHYSDGRIGFWVAAFLLSKIPELMDTVFLVLQKKDVIFLHWFHHVTVMLYCWHAYIMQMPTGLWFATMNYFVHSIMYLYYFLTAIGARAVVKPIAPLITALQLVQMVAGITITILGHMWTSAGVCNADPINSRLGLAMYTSYFVLFALLFKKLYLTKKPRGAAGKEKQM